MQKLRPYLLPGLFVFHLMTVCVLLTTVSSENEISEVTALVTVFSHFFLTALFAGLGPGPWALRIFSWGALAVLSWISSVFLAMRSGAPTPNGNDAWYFPLAPLIAWGVLVTLLLCLRAIPFLKWRFALQPTSLAPQSIQTSLTRGILIIVATWSGVLMLLKDSWPWSVLATEVSRSPDDLLMFSGGAAIVGAGALVVAMLAVGLTLTRLADWMFYRRRWTLPLLVAAVVCVVLFLVLSIPNTSQKPLVMLWLLVALATQPLTALLALGMAGYRLAPRRQPKRCDSESAAQTAQTITEARVKNWVSRLQRVHFAAPVTVLVFLGWIGLTGLWNDHFVSVFLGQVERTAAGEITHLELNSSVTDAGLVHIKGLTKLETLALGGQITDAGLVHLKGLPNLERLHLPGQTTDAGLAHLKGLDNLWMLLLIDTQVTDAGLIHLKDLPNLRVLILAIADENKVTEAGLVHLKKLTGIQKIVLPPHITDAGVADLKKALPNCDITRGFL